MVFISFWILPIISAVAWLGTLLAMFIVWEVEGSPHYPSMDPDQHIAYISDIGASFLKPLFITGCVLTTLFLDLSFAAERWLRHTGALAKNTSRSEKVLSAIAILWAIVGTAGLILLSIFDTLHHPRLHDIFLLLFIAGYLLSAIFLCAEYQRLGVHQRNIRILRVSFWIKLVFIIVEVALAVAFAVCTFSKRLQAGAVLEWVVALIFTFWVMSFFVDLLPAMRSKRGGGDGAPQFEMSGGAGAGKVTHGGDGVGGVGMANGDAEAGYGGRQHPHGQTAYANGNGYANGNASGHVNGVNYGGVPGNRTSKPLPAAQNF